MESNPCDAMVPLPPVGRAARAWRECPYDVMVILLFSAHISLHAPKASGKMSISGKSKFKMYLFTQEELALLCNT